MQQSRFLRACRREPVDVPPVWLMRQAGRFLPSYRALRDRYSFSQLCRTPELAAEVTLQPVDQLEVDAAVVFSDILVLPEAMGLRVAWDGDGPLVLPTLSSAADVDRLAEPDPTSDLRFLLEAVRLASSRLAGRVPVIGFAGAPLTLAAYMIEGQGGHSLARLKAFLYRDRPLAHRLLEKLARSVAALLRAQVESGAAAVQLFDTWAGILGADDFDEYVLPYVQRIAESLDRSRAPLVYFSRGTGHVLDRLRGCGADVVSLDWTVDLAHARSVLGDSVAVQGNLDPAALLAPHEELRRRTRRVLDQAGSSPGHVFNLGHGVLPETSPEAVRVMIDEVRAPRLAP